MEKLDDFHSELMSSSKERKIQSPYWKTAIKMSQLHTVDLQEKGHSSLVLCIFIELGVLLLQINTMSLANGGTVRSSYLGEEYLKQTFEPGHKFIYSFLNQSLQFERANDIVIEILLVFTASLAVYKLVLVWMMFKKKDSARFAHFHTQVSFITLNLFMIPIMELAIESFHRLSWYFYPLPAIIIISRPIELIAHNLITNDYRYLRLNMLQGRTYTFMTIRNVGLFFISMFLHMIKEKSLWMGSVLDSMHFCLGLTLLYVKLRHMPFIFHPAFNRVVSACLALYLTESFLQFLVTVLPRHLHCIDFDVMLLIGTFGLYFLQMNFEALQQKQLLLNSKNDPLKSGKNQNVIFYCQSLYSFWSEGRSQNDVSGGQAHLTLMRAMHSHFQSCKNPMCMCFLLKIKFDRKLGPKSTLSALDVMGRLRSLLPGVKNSKIVTFDDVSTVNLIRQCHSKTIHGSIDKKTGLVNLHSSLLSGEYNGDSSSVCLDSVIDTSSSENFEAFVASIYSNALASLRKEEKKVNIVLSNASFLLYTYDNPLSALMLIYNYITSKKFREEGNIWNSVKVANCIDKAKKAFYAKENYSEETVDITKVFRFRKRVHLLREKISEVALSKIAFYQSMMANQIDFPSFLSSGRKLNLQIKTLKKEIKELIKTKNQKNIKLFQEAILFETLALEKPCPSTYLATSFIKVSREIREQNREEKTDQEGGPQLFNSSQIILFTRRQGKTFKLTSFTSNALNFFWSNREDLEGVALSSLLPSFVAPIHDIIMTDYINGDRNLKPGTSLRTAIPSMSGSMRSIDVLPKLECLFLDDVFIAGMISVRPKTQKSVLYTDYDGRILGLSSRCRDLFGSTPQFSSTFGQSLQNGSSPATLFSIFPRLFQVFHSKSIRWNGQTYSPYPGKETPARVHSGEGKVIGGLDGKVIETSADIDKGENNFKSTLKGIFGSKKDIKPPERTQFNEIGKIEEDDEEEMNSKALSSTKIYTELYVFPMLENLDATKNTLTNIKQFKSRNSKIYTQSQFSPLTPKNFPDEIVPLKAEKPPSSSRFNYRDLSENSTRKKTLLTPNNSTQSGFPTKIKDVIQVSNPLHEEYQNYSRTNAFFEKLNGYQVSLRNEPLPSGTRPHPEDGGYNLKSLSSQKTTINPEIRNLESVLEDNSTKNKGGSGSSSFAFNKSPTKLGSSKWRKVSENLNLSSSRLLISTITEILNFQRELIKKNLLDISKANVIVDTHHYKRLQGIREIEIDGLTKLGGLSKEYFKIIVDKEGSKKSMTSAANLIEATSKPDLPDSEVNKKIKSSFSELLTVTPDILAKLFSIGSSLHKLGEIEIAQKAQNCLNGGVTSVLGEQDQKNNLNPSKSGQKVFFRLKNSNFDIKVNFMPKLSNSLPLRIAKPEHNSTTPFVVPNKNLSKNSRFISNNPITAYCAIDQSTFKKNRPLQSSSKEKASKNSYFNSFVNNKKEEELEVESSVKDIFDFSMPPVSSRQAIPVVFKGPANCFRKSSPELVKQVETDLPPRNNTCLTKITSPKPQRGVSPDSPKRASICQEKTNLKLDTTNTNPDNQTVSISKGQARCHGENRNILHGESELSSESHCRNLNPPQIVLPDRNRTEEASRSQPSKYTRDPGDRDSRWGHENLGALKKSLSDGIMANLNEIHLEYTNKTLQAMVLASIKWVGQIKNQGQTSQEATFQAYTAGTLATLADPSVLDNDLEEEDSHSQVNLSVESLSRAFAGIAPAEEASLRASVSSALRTDDQHYKNLRNRFRLGDKKRKKYVYLVFVMLFIALVSGLLKLTIVYFSKLSIKKSLKFQTEVFHVAQMMIPTVYFLKESIKYLMLQKELVEAPSKGQELLQLYNLHDHHKISVYFSEAFREQLMETPKSKYLLGTLPKIHYSFVNYFEGVDDSLVKSHQNYWLTQYSVSFSVLHLFWRESERLHREGLSHVASKNLLETVKICSELFHNNQEYFRQTLKSTNSMLNLAWKMIVIKIAISMFCSLFLVLIGGCVYKTLIKKVKTTADLFLTVDRSLILEALQRLEAKFFGDKPVPKSLYTDMRERSIKIKTFKSISKTGTLHKSISGFHKTSMSSSSKGTQRISKLNGKIIESITNRNPFSSSVHRFVNYPKLNLKTMLITLTLTFLFLCSPLFTSFFLSKRYLGQMIQKVSDNSDAYRSTSSVIMSVTSVYYMYFEKAFPLESSWESLADSSQELSSRLVATQHLRDKNTMICSLVEEVLGVGEKEQCLKINYNKDEKVVKAVYNFFSRVDQLEKELKLLHSKASVQETFHNLAASEFCSELSTLDLISSYLTASLRAESTSFSAEEEALLSQLLTLNFTMSVFFVFLMVLFSLLVLGSARAHLSRWRGLEEGLACLNDQTIDRNSYIKSYFHRV